jgi:CRISPR system Cascade subunit CasA
MHGHTFNLIATPWIPVIRATGRRDRMRPAGLTDGIDADPILDVNWPRGDFRCATLEFLIGLLTVAFPPRDNWREWWMRPPSKAELETAFAPLAAAFSFDGD